MDEIQILNEERKGNVWHYDVSLTDGKEVDTYRVTLDDSYWSYLTGEKIKRKNFVKKSFKFLLAHEPKNNILPSFNLEIIQEYFPMYEKTIMKET